PRAGTLGAEARERELERRCAHLGPEAAALEALAEPRAGGDGSRGRELLPLERLRPGGQALGPDAQEELPPFRSPRRPSLFVEADEAVDELRLRRVVRPGDPEPHRLRIR